MGHRKCLASEPYTLCTSERGSHRRAGGSGRHTVLEELRSWLLAGPARRCRSASGGTDLRPTDGKRRSASFRSSRLGGGLAPGGGDRLPGELRDRALERKSRWPQVAQERVTEERARLRGGTASSGGVGGDAGGRHGTGREASGQGLARCGGCRGAARRGKAGSRLAVLGITSALVRRKKAVVKVGGGGGTIVVVGGGLLW
ncbi:putative pollen-specific leucine-rich repeat extensin-like protein 3 [Iris pallida]|uniref:Pollen-specific leucine-rich repeat extensin-like protein 3 n=1 Tax=Iris pallida TaxID=29817 RepID=A0AAX6GB85_IRIPA|nr:putative pollen-specific leucine-rich repeat extensin-like protein 3 [Iris pallida]